MADLPKYPPALPKPLIEGYGFSAVSPLMRTDMQSGRAKQRMKYRSTPTQAGVSWLFRRQEAVLFESWFQGVVGDGATWFECELQTPMGLSLHKCRFVDIYDGPTLIAPEYWKFTATLELVKRPIIDGSWAIYYPEALLHGNLIDVALSREWPRV